MAITGVIRNIIYVEDVQKVVIFYRDGFDPEGNYFSIDIHESD